MSVGSQIDRLCQVVPNININSVIICPRSLITCSGIYPFTVVFIIGLSCPLPIIIVLVLLNLSTESIITMIKHKGYVSDRICSEAQPVHYTGDPHQQTHIWQNVEAGSSWPLLLASSAGLTVSAVMPPETHKQQAVWQAYLIAYGNF